MTPDRLKEMEGRELPMVRDGKTISKIVLSVVNGKLMGTLYRLDGTEVGDVKLKNEPSGRVSDGVNGP